LSETCAAGTATTLTDCSYGNVGIPVPCVEVRLKDVPEMNYWAKDGKGEVCFRGPSIFLGYFKDEAKTKESFDSDGFFLTGDIGKWNPDGSLTLIDRKKNIFKLSHGEYIAIEYVESQYLQAKHVQQIFIYGDSLQSCLVAIVVPDFDSLASWVREKKLDMVQIFIL